MSCRCPPHAKLSEQGSGHYHIANIELTTSLRIDSAQRWVLGSNGDISTDTTKLLHERRSWLTTWHVGTLNVNTMELVDTMIRVDINISKILNWSGSISLIG